MIDRNARWGKRYWGKTKGFKLSACSYVANKLKFAKKFKAISLIK